MMEKEKRTGTRHPAEKRENGGDPASGRKARKRGKPGMAQAEKKRKRVRGWRAATVLYILVFSLISLAFLERFPYVHSDESWLAGLSRGMLAEKSIGVTEAFFDLKPRYPHAIKTVFHLMQMGMISVFGYSVRTVRLLSWLGGAAALWMCFLSGARFLGSEKKGFFLMAVFSVDIQFLYASHFARQEILLCLMQWVCIWILFSPKGFYNRKCALMLALCTGFSVGLHPNSFLLGTMNGLCLLTEAVRGRKAAWGRKRASGNGKPAGNRLTKREGTESAESAGMKTAGSAGTKTAGAETAGSADTETAGKKKSGTARWEPLVLYVLVTGCLAAGFVALSYKLDSGFLRHYFANGAEEFGIDAGGWEKFTGFFGFLKRLYQRSSGTYYVPDIRFQFFLFGAGFLMAAAAGGVMRKELPELAGKIGRLLTAAAGIVAGMMIIGRYNQTSILFLFPFGYMAAAVALELFDGKIKKGLWALLLAAVLSLSVFQISQEMEKGSYRAYERQITELIPAGAKVLGNLNMEFFLDYDCLRDYRNLPYALEGDGLEAYLEENGIEYIVYHQELDFLWEHRPYFNVIYGNVMFVEELKEYCEEYCQPVGSFEDPWYGIRVAELRGREEYARVTVYRRASASAS